MELREFAKVILFEAGLEHKLMDPGPLTDREPGAPLAVPEAPARVRALRLPGVGTKDKTPFPSAKALEQDESRGTVLHFFANHELLALELMALALLRFPGAPAGFRMGLAHTMVEEQKHLRLYVERMRELGVDFGTVPVNRYFWDALKAMRSPLDYTVRMSMTFEQANLDYSLHFKELFARIGDTKTASIMETVYREEIGHVKHGVTWFNRMRDDAVSDWAAYQAILAAPLSPVRAKGLGFDAAARREAGLSEEFIQELGVYGHSKGRPPTVYWFNPGSEEEIADPRPHCSPPKVAQVLAADLSLLMSFVASRDDVVVCPVKPGRAQLEALQHAGFPAPQCVEALAELKGRKLGRFEPWGKTPAAAHQAVSAGLAFQEAPVWEVGREVYSKAWSARLAREHGWFESALCDSLSSVETALESVLARHELAVIKAPLGASGRSMLRVPSSGLIENQKRWINKQLQRQRELIVEPWLERVVDLSVQLQVGAEKPVLGVMRLVNDARGQYLGHVLGRRFADLAQPVVRFLHEGGCFEALQETGRIVAAALAKEAYAGPAGVDAFVYRTVDGLALRRLCEINPRHTMGRIALVLGKRILAGARGVWVHLTSAQVQSLGYESFLDFASAMREQYPLRMKDEMIADGFLATNDPNEAQMVLSALFVGTAVDVMERPGSPLRPLCFSRGDSPSL